MDLKSVLSDFDSADPTSSGGYAPKIQSRGTHKVRVESVNCRPSNKDARMLYIVEFTVLETNSEDVETGTRYAWVHNLLQKHYGASNVKQFLAACAGIDVFAGANADDIGIDDVEESYNEDQPCAGAIVMLDTDPSTTEKGFPFVKHRWHVANDD